MKKQEQWRLIRGQNFIRNSDFIFLIRDLKNKCYDPGAFLRNNEGYTSLPLLGVETSRTTWAIQEHCPQHMCGRSTLQHYHRSRNKSLTLMSLGHTPHPRVGSWGDLESPDLTSLFWATANGVTPRVHHSLCQALGEIVMACGRALSCLTEDFVPRQGGQAVAEVPASAASPMGAIPSSSHKKQLPPGCWGSEFKVCVYRRDFQTRVAGEHCGCLLSSGCQRNFWATTS